MDDEEHVRRDVQLKKESRKQVSHLEEEQPSCDADGRETRKSAKRANESCYEQGMDGGLNVDGQSDGHRQMPTKAMQVQHVDHQKPENDDEKNGGCLEN